MDNEEYLNLIISKEEEEKLALQIEKPNSFIAAYGNSHKCEFDKKKEVLKATELHDSTNVLFSIMRQRFVPDKLNGLSELIGQVDKASKKAREEALKEYGVTEEEAQFYVKK